MQILTRTEFNSLEDLFIYEIEDLYDAEKRLAEALPKMVEVTSNTKLRATLTSHLNETQRQAERLEMIFQKLDREPERETCDAMKGLLKECQEVIDAKADDAVRDAAIIAAAQRVEHYEMAGYGTARNLARKIGQDEAADLLQQSLNEEGEADATLTLIAEEEVNALACQT